MSRVNFKAPEYRRDTSWGWTDYKIEGSREVGWQICRDGQTHLELGPGYRLLKTQCCGVCSTDLDRHHLPFPLPQVTGHEMVVRTEEGERCVVEINASHAARAIESDCVFCQQGLERHCPDRLVLGIHDLPGGFGPYVLVPEKSVLPIPEALSTETAVLIEPFAAAVNAATRIKPRAGETVAVLGPRRLGLLVVAALAGWRRASGIDFEILALSRHDSLLAMAEELGADRGMRVVQEGNELPSGLADVIVDTTGSPSGLELALRLARREVHLKSTHGQEALGLSRLTELVVDELSLEGFNERCARQFIGAWKEEGRGLLKIAWMSHADPPEWLCEQADVHCETDALTARKYYEQCAAPGQLPRADVAVVDRLSQIDEALRPASEDQLALVRPRGEFWLRPPVTAEGTMVEALSVRGLRLSSSRCGDFSQALKLLSTDPVLAGIGKVLITSRFPATQIQEAFVQARSPQSIKVLVQHPHDA